MRRSVLIVLLLAALASTSLGQTNREAERGDPPVAALISVSEPDDAGIVTISGAAGAVFPAAQVGVRNLFTQETVYTNAGITGTFSVSLYGPGRTPFLISPAETIPFDERERPGAIPGGPATIIYGANPVPRTPTEDVTQLIIDGSLDDWDTYPQSRLTSEFYALANTDSLYLAFDRPLPDDAVLVVVFSLDNVTYELALNPLLPQAALLREVAPVERDAVTLSFAAAIDADATQGEVRFSLADIDPAVETAVLEQTFIRINDDATDVTTVTQALPVFDERDGIIYPGGRIEGDVTRFYIAGPLGESFWSATGRVNTLAPAPGDTLTVEMDLTLNAPDVPASLVGLALIGEMSLQPVAIGEGGEQPVAARYTNNGWSNLTTPNGLAIDNVRGDVRLGRAVVPAPRVVRRGDQLLVGMRFDLPLPPNLPVGLYVPVFTGFAQIGNGDVFRWGSGEIFGAPTPDVPSRLPVVLSVGGVEAAQLPWALLHDSPSDGSRGLLPDQAAVALSNRVRFNSPTYVLPPGDYPLEPYLLNQLDNTYDLTLAPLLPLLFPGGRVQATVTRPDGEVDELANTAIAQNRLSTEAPDERDRFGGQAPLDVYRLATASDIYQNYTFDQYGTYALTVTGSVEDVNGNRYTGGGDYSLLIAEPLDLTPGTLPGMPFFVGDTLFVGGRVTPGFPAEITATLRLHTLEGEDVEQTFSGVADRYGFFALDDVPLDTPGEYILDYEARFEDADGRLWAASLRSAGVIAPVDDPLVARGTRGLDGEEQGFPPAWFDADVYPPLDSLSTTSPRPNTPYFSGDIAFVSNSRDSGVRGVLQVQDRFGAYERWLVGAVPDYRSPDDLTIVELARVDELPLQPVLGGPLAAFGEALLPGFIVNDAYAYVSAVRPDVTVRQYVVGRDDPTLPLYWDSQDPLNGQIGAGAGGMLPGDYVFLFGGTVVRNAEAGVRSISPYASLAVIKEDNAGVYPPYAGAAGGAPVGPLLDVGDGPLDVFFHLTGLRPGQVLPLDAPLILAGQAAPTLTSRLDATLIAPSGETYTVSGMTNTLGYFYDPDQAIIADEAGMWQVTLQVTPAGPTSIGEVQLPIPVGGIPGAADGTFFIYVVPDNVDALTWAEADAVDRAFNPATRFNFQVDVPAGWTDVNARYTVTTPGYVLDAGELPVFSNSVAYPFNPFTLGERFPYETSGAGDGPGGSDVVTITVAMRGLDDGGDRAIRTRTFVILHDRLITRP